MGRLVNSQMKWAGHVARMDEDRLHVHREKGQRRRGRSRWLDCTKRAEVEDKDYSVP